MRTGPGRLLVVTAVPAERAAVLAGVPDGVPSGDSRPRDSDQRDPDQRYSASGLPAREAVADVVTAEVTVIAGGVGMAAAASATAGALVAAAADGSSFALVISAGIGGGFLPTAPVGTLAVADALVAADLGAETPEGFASLDALGLGRAELAADGPLVRRLAAALADRGAVTVTGPIVTVSTVTGTASRAAMLAARHPGCVAEGMEGYGVAVAAQAHGVPVTEVRAVSNPVGPRDRASWRIPEALDRLRLLVPALLAP